jgi:hypothetical protein
LGISNILALRGDPPRSDEYGFTVDVQADYFQHADDLVKYIRQEYKDTFCIGVAGYPTPHPDSETPDSEMRWLKVKCDAGADFVITQLFYDMDAFEKWVRECRAAGEFNFCEGGANADDRYHYTDHTRCYADSEFFIFQAAGQIDGMSCTRYHHEGARAN